MERIILWLRGMLTGPRGIAIAAAIGVIVVAVGAGVYLLVRPPERGVLPLGPEDFVQGEFLVKFRPGAAADEHRNFNAQNRVDEIDDIPALGITRMRVPPGNSVNGMVNVYRRNPNVEFAEPNYVRGATDTPDDTYFSRQWAAAKINAPAAWDRNPGSPSIVIAVLDTGMNPSHEDFIGKFASPPVADDNGHGTLVGGVAAALTGNSKGVAGICRGCRILSFKVLNSTGTGADSAIATAITQAADQGARVINLSLGSYSQSSTMQSAVDYAWNHGVVIIGAAGNDGLTTPFYPAAYNHVLAVGATDSNDGRLSTSNYGPWLGVVAPGAAVLSTKMDGSYDFASGTSIAAPHVAGLAGLILSASPGFSNQQVVDLIKSSATDLGPAGRDDQYGTGRIDADRALSAVVAGGNPTVTPTVTPTATPTTTTAATTTLTATHTATSTTVGATLTSTSAVATSTSAPATATATRSPSATPVPPTATSAPPTASRTATPAAVTATRTIVPTNTPRGRGNQR